MSWQTMQDFRDSIGEWPVSAELVDVPLAGCQHVRCKCNRVIAARETIQTHSGFACTGCIDSEARKMGPGKKGKDGMRDKLGGRRP